MKAEGNLARGDGHVVKRLVVAGAKLLPWRACWQGINGAIACGISMAAVAMISVALKVELHQVCPWIA